MTSTDGTSRNKAIFIAIAFGLLATCFGGGYYVYNKYGKQMIADTRVALEEGKTFAATTDNAGCVTEVTSRYKTDNEMVGGTKQLMFLSSCLERSTPTPGFCSSVPGAKDMDGTKVFQRERCGKIDADNIRCPIVMSAVQRFCHPTA